ncbi:hypothetical protein ACWCQV_25595, partial [Streptomyces eurythermus]
VVVDLGELRDVDPRPTLQGPLRRIRLLELLRRLQELPGFGKQKAQIFLALLGKRLGVAPEGWREAAGAYGEPGSFRSVADITGPESLAKVRAHKQEMKAAAKAAKKK